MTLGVESKQREILNFLHKEALRGNIQALEELSHMAMGCNLEARRLSQDIDSRHIHIAPERIGSASSGSGASEINAYPPLIEWSPKDRSRMAQGLKPKGHPIHNL